VEVGELVTLSAYGKKISVNFRVRGKVGIILVVQRSEVPTPVDVYKIMWSGGGGTMYHIRRDLKRAKEQK
jgi:hypothetical protein